MTGSSTVRFLVVAGISGAIAWFSYRRKCFGGRTPETPVSEQRLVARAGASAEEEEEDVEVFLRGVQKKDLHKLERLLALSRAPETEVSEPQLKQVVRRMTDVLGAASAKPRATSEVVEQALLLMATRPEISVDAADLLVEACRDKLRHGVEIPDAAVSEILKHLANKKLSASLVQRLLRAVFYLCANKTNAARIPLAAVMDAVLAQQHSPGVLIDGLNAVGSLVANGNPELNRADLAKAFREIFAIAETSDASKNVETLWRSLGVLMAMHACMQELHAGISALELAALVTLAFAALARHGVSHRQLAERALHLLVTVGAKASDDERRQTVASVVAAHSKTLPVLTFYAAQL